MVSRSFIKLWEPMYETWKYPDDFYRSHMDSARDANNHEQLKHSLIALLNWKDGKAKKFQTDAKNHAKPNIIRPILDLANTALEDFAKLFSQLLHANENNVMEFAKNFRVKLSCMWKTVVIPAFVLHVARPDRLPIIDQHTVRAFIALTSGKIVKKPVITWDQWRDYSAFFKNAVVDAGYDNNVEEHCKVDRALFAWGKSLKSQKVPKEDRTAELQMAQTPEVVQMINGPKFWGQLVPNSGIIPPNCNILKALQNYLNLGSLDELPQWEKQNLRDLQFHLVARLDLIELLNNPGGSISRRLLQSYTETTGEVTEISMLPRPILDVFLVGWANNCGIYKTKRMAAYLHQNGFGGTVNASMAAVYVGKTTGKLFGLLDKAGNPTALFHEYFEYEQLPL